MTQEIWSQELKMKEYFKICIHIIVLSTKEDVKSGVNVREIT